MPGTQAQAFGPRLQSLWKTAFFLSLGCPDTASFKLALAGAVLLEGSLPDVPWGHCSVDSGESVSLLLKVPQPVSSARQGDRLPGQPTRNKETCTVPCTDAESGVECVSSAIADAGYRALLSTVIFICRSVLHL